MRLLWKGYNFTVSCQKQYRHIRLHTFSYISIHPYICQKNRNVNTNYGHCINIVRIAVVSQIITMVGLMNKIHLHACLGLLISVLFLISSSQIHDTCH